MPKPKMPLRAVVRDGCLVISVDAETVKFATENHPDFWDGEAGVYTLIVKNKLKWLRSVVDSLNSESAEDGSTILTSAMDKALALAAENGEVGVEFFEP